MTMAPMATAIKKIVIRHSTIMKMTNKLKRAGGRLMQILALDDDNDDGYDNDNDKVKDLLIAAKDRDVAK